MTDADWEQCHKREAPLARLYGIRSARNCEDSLSHLSTHVFLRATGRFYNTNIASIQPMSLKDSVDIYVYTHKSRQ